MKFLMPFKHKIPNLLLASKTANASFFRWILTLIVSVICWISLISLTTTIIAVLFPQFSQFLISNATVEDRNYQTLFNLAVLALYIPVLGFSMWIVKMPLRSLINPRGQIGYFQIILTGMITLTILVASIGVDYSTGSTISFHFWNSDKIAFIVISFCAIIFQATAEELFFRGIIIQILSKLTHSFWILLIIPSLMFSLMHMGNPEIGEMGVLVHGFYISLGLVLTALTLFTGRLESSIGLHIANNIFVFLIVNNTAYPSLANNLGLFSIYQRIDIFTLSVSVITYFLIMVVILYAVNRKSSIHELDT